MTRRHPSSAAGSGGRPLPDDRVAGRLRRECGVGIVLITRGARGVSVYSDGRRRDIPGRRVPVADTIGAGDEFTAAFLAHFLQTGDALEAARRGNLPGAWVASRPSAVPAPDGDFPQQCVVQPPFQGSGHVAAALASGPLRERHRD